MTRGHPVVLPQQEREKAGCLGRNGALRFDQVDPGRKLRRTKAVTFVCISPQRFSMRQIRTLGYKAVSSVLSRNSENSLPPFPKRRDSVPSVMRGSLRQGVILFSRALRYTQVRGTNLRHDAAEPFPRQHLTPSGRREPRPVSSKSLPSGRYSTSGTRPARRFLTRTAETDSAPASARRDSSSSVPGARAPRRSPR
jgi:hypothetical protein